MEIKEAKIEIVLSTEDINKMIEMYIAENGYSLESYNISVKAGIPNSTLKAINCLCTKL